MDRKANNMIKTRAERRKELREERRLQRKHYIRSKLRANPTLVRWHFKEG